VRPDVVLFDEPLPEPELQKLWRELGRGFDAVISVGTSSHFPYVAEPVIDARRRGVPTIEINPGRTHLSDLVDVRVELGAAEALAAIRAGCLGRRARGAGSSPEYS
jgi:NAD-dependent deacetylase